MIEFAVNRRGVTLVAVLVLLAIVSLLGVTILETSSTEIAMAGHYRRNLVALYAAEAGGEEARVRLRGPESGNPFFLGGQDQQETARWSAYLSAVPTWTVNDDERYSLSSTNYFPTLSNRMNMRIVANSVQSRVQYWVKVQHKTEYDAERAGHRVMAPHYLDRDGDLRRHRRRTTSQVIYYGFPSGYAGAPVQFTTNGKSPFAPVERITAYGIAGTARSVIEMEVVHPAPLPHLAAMYARGGVHVSTALLVEVSGRDQCGQVGAVSAIYTSTPSTTEGAVRISGVSPSLQTGPTVLDIDQAIAGLNRGARPLASGESGSRSLLGDSTHPAAVYAATSTMIQNLTGYGLLLASGDLTLVGPLVWRGPILSSGRLRIHATNGDVTIEGIVWAGSVTITGAENARIVVRYHSCHVKTAFMSLPLQVISWRERT